MPLSLPTWLALPAGVLLSVAAGAFPVQTGGEPAGVYGGPAQHFDGPGLGIVHQSGEQVEAARAGGVAGMGAVQGAVQGSGRGR